MGRDEFVALLRALSARLGKDPAAYQNVTSEALLDAMAAWVEDSDGYYANTGSPEPKIDDWRPVADLIQGGLVYE